VNLADRILQVRRAACRDALIGGGLSAEQAERWCDAWEGHAVLEGREGSAEFWEVGRRWIDEQIAARRTPQSFSAKRTG
jgi:hypothetical protein